MWYVVCWERNLLHLQKPISIINQFSWFQCVFLHLKIAEVSRQKQKVNWRGSHIELVGLSLSWYWDEIRTRHILNCIAHGSWFIWVLRVSARDFECMSLVQSFIRSACALHHYHHFNSAIVIIALTVRVSECVRLLLLLVSLLSGNFFPSSVKCFFFLFAIRYFYYRTLFIDWSKYFLMPFWVESVLNVIVWFPFPFPFLFNAIILYHIILLSFFSKTRVRWHICDAKPKCSNLYMQILPSE